MSAHPELVAFDGALDTELMRAHPRLVCKIGAEGVLGIGLPDGRGAALKVLDGATRALDVVAPLLLEEHWDIESAGPRSTTCATGRCTTRAASGWAAPRRRSPRVIDAAAIARDTAALVQVPSLTGDERAVLERLAELAEALGLEAELHEHDLAALRAHPDHPGEEAPRDGAARPGGHRCPATRPGRDRAERPRRRRDGGQRAVAPRPVVGR